LTIIKGGDILSINKETVEAGVTAMMPLQRVCGAEMQARNKLSNGPLRVRRKCVVFAQSILHRVGIR